MIEVQNFFHPLAIPVIENYYRIHQKSSSLRAFQKALKSRVDFSLTASSGPHPILMVNGLFSTARKIVEQATDQQTEFCFVDDSRMTVEFAFEDQQIGMFNYDRKPLFLRDLDGIKIWGYERSSEHLHVLLLRSEGRGLLNWKGIRRLLDELNSIYPTITARAATKPDSLVGSSRDMDWRFKTQDGISGLQRYWERLGCKLGANNFICRGKEPTGWNQILRDSTVGAVDGSMKGLTTHQ